MDHLSPDGSDSSPKCKEGYVTLTEPDRPAVGGHWCGHGWGQAVFYSETSRVTLTLTLVNVQGNPGTFAFDFRLSYKLLRKRDSIVRYGTTVRPYFRGQLLPGTFCSLIYDACDKRRCALQSPNFPGIYTPNVTCYYAIKQLNAPAGHRAVIQLVQNKDHLIFIRNGERGRKGMGTFGGHGSSLSGPSGEAMDGSSGAMSSEITVGDNCDASTDHATIYDGYTIRDPVLLRFCGSGKLPVIASSGNELLLEFFSASTAYLLQTSPPTPIQVCWLDIQCSLLLLSGRIFLLLLLFEVVTEI